MLQVVSDSHVQEEGAQGNPKNNSCEPQWLNLGWIFLCRAPGEIAVHHDRLLQPTPSKKPSQYLLSQLCDGLETESKCPRVFG